MDVGFGDGPRCVLKFMTNLGELNTEIQNDFLQDEYRFLYTNELAIPPEWCSNYDHDQDLQQIMEFSFTIAKLIPLD